MCIICIKFQKQLITANEAHGILFEIGSTIEPEHLAEIEMMLRIEREYDDA